MRRGQAGGIASPGFRQIKRTVNESMAVLGHVSREYADPAVGDPSRKRSTFRRARRPGVLAPHPTGRVALLEKAGLVDHQHAIRVGQRFQRIVAHHVAQRIRIPTPTPENGLLPPRSRITRRLGTHPSGLASLRPKQAIQEQGRRRRHTGLDEQRLYAGLHIAQRRRPELQHRLHRGTRHPQPSRATRGQHEQT